MSGLSEPLSLCLASCSIPRSPLHSSLNHSVSRRLLPGEPLYSLPRTSRPPNIRCKFCVVHLVHPLFPRKVLQFHSTFPRKYHAFSVMINDPFLMKEISSDEIYVSPLPFSPLPTKSYHEDSNFWLRILKQNLPLLLFCSNMAGAVEIKETKADADPGALSLILDSIFHLHESSFQFPISNL